MVDHHGDQRREADARPPAELLSRLPRIALQKIDLRRSKIARIDLDVFLPLETDMAEGHLDKLAHAIRLTCSNDVVVGFVLLQHKPHCFDIVAGKAPIALSLKIAKIKSVLQAFLDAPDCAGDLARDKRFAAARTLVIEENAITDEHPVGFPVVYRIP